MGPIVATGKKGTTWGLYPWFAEHGTELVHPDDVEAWIALQPYGLVFERIGEAGEFIKLAYGGQVFRVKPDLFRPVQPPLKRIGDVVRVELSGALTEAVVVEIKWHFKRGEPFFLVEKKGKRSKKRYWASDFK